MKRRAVMMSEQPVFDTLALEIGDREDLADFISECTSVSVEFPPTEIMEILDRTYGHAVGEVREIVAPAKTKRVSVPSLDRSLKPRPGGLLEVLVESRVTDLPETQALEILPGEGFPEEGEGD